MMVHRRTIKKEISFSSVALHNGLFTKMKLIPSNCGDILIRRTDLNCEFKLSKKDFLPANLCSVIGSKQCQIGTVEHLFSALHVFKISDLIIEISGSEVPILDGSALPYALQLKKTSFDNLPDTYYPIKPNKKIELHEEKKYLSIEPAGTLQIFYEIDFNHSLIGNQKFDLEINEDSFEKEIAPARTFGFTKDLEYLKNMNLAKGASLENVIALDENELLNKEGLRFKDEFVRHKIVDLLGDLYLNGFPVFGKINAKFAGHEFHQKFLKKLTDK